MEIKITKTNTIKTKYNLGVYVYVYEGFEIKRRKIVSIVYGDIAARLKRTYTEYYNNNEVNSRYAYELTTGQIYSEDELFKTESELKERLLCNFSSMFRRQDIVDAALNNPAIMCSIKQLRKGDLCEVVRQELREKLLEPVKQEIASKILPGIVEEVKSDVRKKFAVTFNEFTDRCMA